MELILSCVIINLRRGGRKMTEETSNTYATGFKLGWENCRKHYFNPNILKSLERLECCDDKIMEDLEDKERKAIDKALKYYITDELLREKAIDDIEILLSKMEKN